MITKKEERFQRRLEERQTKRGPTKAEQLADEGLKYVNFCLPIQLFDTWAQGVIAMGERPNDRIKTLIIKDMKGGL